jgi:hypothetical protein
MDGQEPDTTPQMTDAEADETGLVRPEKIKELLSKYSAVLPTELPAGLPPDRDAGHTIRLEENAVAPFKRNRRMSPLEME